MKIKEIIYKHAKILEKQAGIDAEQLASMVFYHILNKPYFKNSYDFLKLGYNDFDEIVLGHEKMDKINEASFEDVNPKCISFKNKGQSDDSPILIESVILNNNSRNILIEFKDMIICSNSLSELVDSIVKKEQEDPLFFQNVIYYMNEDKYSYNSEKNIIQILFPLIIIQPQNEILVENSEINNKKSNYRPTKRFNSYEFKDLLGNRISELLKKSNNEIKESLLSTNLANMFIYDQSKNTSNLPALNLDNWDNLTKSEKLNTFEMIQSIPSLYNACAYKYLLELEDSSSRIIEMLNYKFYDTSKNNAIKKINTILSLPSIEEVCSPYNEYINSIIEKVDIKFPLLNFQKYENMPIELTIINNINNEINATKNIINHVSSNDNINLYSNDFFDFQQSIKGLTNSTYDSVNNYSSRKINILIKNEIENFAHTYAIKGTVYKNDNFDSLSIYNINFISHLYDEKYAKMIIDPLLKICREDKLIFVYSFFHPTDNNRSIENYIEEIKIKNPDIIFLNDGNKPSYKETFTFNLKNEMLKLATKENIPYETVLLINNKIDKYVENENNIPDVRSSINTSEFNIREHTSKLPKDFYDEIKNIKKTTKLKV